MGHYAQEEYERAMEQVARAAHYLELVRPTYEHRRDQLREWVRYCIGLGLSVRQVASATGLPRETVRRWAKFPAKRELPEPITVPSPQELKERRAAKRRATGAAAPPRPPGEGRQSSDGGRAAAEGASK